MKYSFQDVEDYLARINSQKNLSWEDGKAKESMAEIIIKLKKIIAGEAYDSRGIISSGNYPFYSGNFGFGGSENSSVQQQYNQSSTVVESTGQQNYNITSNTMTRGDYENRGGENYRISSQPEYLPNPTISNVPNIANSFGGNYAIGGG